MLLAIKSCSQELLLLSSSGGSVTHFAFLTVVNQKLGFASCRRNKGATEGINVLIEKKTLDDKWSYGISCIEYTEFDKFGIVEGPLMSKRYFVPSVLLTT